MARLNQDQLIDEAEFRLTAAGVSPDTVKVLRQGLLPIDLRDVELGISKDQVFQLASELESKADIVIYGAVALNFQNHPAVAYLYIDPEQDNWKFPHELYQGKHPLCFVADLKDANDSTEGYLEVDGAQSRLYKLVSKSEHSVH